MDILFPVPSYYFPAHIALGSYSPQTNRTVSLRTNRKRPHEPITTTKNDPVIAQLVANPFVGKLLPPPWMLPGTTTLFIKNGPITSEQRSSTPKSRGAKGNNYITLPASQLSNGFYTLQLRGKNGKLISAPLKEKKDE